ncbi:MAG: carboxymuconolactone decarboxylase family protein [Betaproteobacteria bacterium]|nr:carboxymuconolactone decarboxylase family protein [Betaproteobacteria bacterium]MDE2002558.1 carboxymuconolactone decarboxylase family protein [Betaproteobacteria bacterium]MDE2210116.1 carboxymuconolactone decarboxylase family protein [Betaproteobacteria bacterium]MDE2360028.1 carboxymuconolactone decarboxylase family protein [Betaproteobacteria bacterium]
MTGDIRVPQVEPGTRPELAGIERAILAERGRISLLYQVLLNSPPIAEGWEKLLTAVRSRTRVPSNLRELAILRVAVQNRASFEYEAHLPHALAAGVPQAKIDAISRWRRGDGSTQANGDPDPFDDDERLMLELADAMTRDIDVPDALFDRLRTRFDARGVVEVVTTIAAYNMVSRVLVALNVGHR